MEKKHVAAAAAVIVGALGLATLAEDRLKKKKRSYSRFKEIPTGVKNGGLTEGVIILEGGSLRGLYTAGVLDVLMENGINMQAVIGVSAGALNGVGYLSGQTGRSARFNLSNRYKSRYFGLRAYMENKSLFGFKYMFSDKVNVEQLDWKAFNDESRRFVAVATDIETGMPVFLEKGKVADMVSAVSASCGLPVISEPVLVDGRRYLDGGCSLNIPYRWAMDEGYKKIIVVRTRERGFQIDVDRKESFMTKLGKVKYKKKQALLESLLDSDRRYNDEVRDVEELEKEGRLFCIAPSIPPTVSRTESDIEKLGDLYMLGRKDAEDSLESLKNYLEK